MDNLLKGNFQVKRPVSLEANKEDEKVSLKERLKKRALASLGGSMVYIERRKLNWDGDEKSI